MGTSWPSLGGFYDPQKLSRGLGATEPALAGGGGVCSKAANSSNLYLAGFLLFWVKAHLPKLCTSKLSLSFKREVSKPFWLGGESSKHDESDSL